MTKESKNNKKEKRWNRKLGTRNLKGPGQVDDISIAYPSNAAAVVKNIKAKLADKSSNEGDSQRRPHFGSKGDSDITGYGPQLGKQQCRP